MIWFDHLLAASIVFVDPVLAKWYIARVIRRIASGEAGARLRMYRWTIVPQWTWVLVLLGVWAWQERPFAWLGLAVPSGREAWITAALCIAAVALYATQIRAALASAEGRAEVLAQFDRSGPGVQAVIPATAPEFRWYLGMSVTAGVCEEIMSRGFMLWYFTAWLPWWAAIAATVATFGIGHAYQGFRGVLLTAAMGSVFLVAYLVTGSLLASIVIHSVVDISSGFAGFRVRTQTRDAGLVAAVI